MAITICPKGVNKYTIILFYLIKRKHHNPENRDVPKHKRHTEVFMPLKMKTIYSSKFSFPAFV